MFINWLFTIFPAEMAHGWTFIRRDILLWVALFSLLAVGSMTVPGADGQVQGAAASIWLLFVPMLINFLAVALFDAAAAEEELNWADVLTMLGRRVLPFAGFITITSLIVLGAGVLVGSGIIVALGGTPFEVPGAIIVSAIIVTSLATRFCYVPFLVVLHSNEDIPEMEGAVASNEVVRSMIWPLLASDRLTDGRRWRLAPYIIITGLGAVPAQFAPPALILPSLVLANMVMLTAQAVMFAYFLDGRERWKMKIPARPTRPEHEENEDESGF